MEESCCTFLPVNMSILQLQIQPNSGKFGCNALVGTSEAPAVMQEAFLLLDVMHELQIELLLIELTLRQMSIPC